ncbi:MAG: isoleucine--tRNA ligase [Candidatus Krumholzibacteria bacterium]|nr:isoleucine--tRNA ligase [Candidatus Krumholzibacteria bacterium]
MAEKETTRKRYPELAPFSEAIKLEAEILAFWEANNVFKRSIEERPFDNAFVFYEGPPTANGRPGVHHALSRTIKDLVCRYQTMKGHRVVRKAGWDTHGLPVEIEVEHQLDINGKDQIEHYGIARFNEKCRESVFKYLDEWLEFTKKLGYWLDLDDPYITFKNDYIESVWWILKQFWDQDMLFQGHKIVPYCPRCGTSLSSHEVSQGYADAQDPSIFIKLKLVDEDAYFLVWTTTPWTLISNVALAVGPDHDYVRVRNKGEVLILAEALVGVLDGDTEILGSVKGADLIGKRYEPCFPFFDKMVDAFRVIGTDFVSLEDGTGIVHMAPAFGEDDYNAGKAENLPMLQPVDPAGKFTPEVTPWAGMFIKDADPEIITDLKKRGILYRSGKITHSYPFCWRCRSPLIYYARRSWYIKTTAFKDLLLEANSKVQWFPPEIGENRFTAWLEGNVDWALSRERYWGTPLNIWTCEACKEQFCIGSVEELRSIAEAFPEEYDLHKPFIDDLDVGCPECGGKMKRVPEVIDCWFDSGSMPFAQYHYPHENMDLFKSQYPAEFISEGVEQSRGWFYSLLVIGAFLTKQSPYKRCLPHGLVLDAAGQKMSKSRGNAVSASDVLASDGADALRWYILASGSPWLPKRFDYEALRDTANRFLGAIRNLYNFFSLYAEIDGFQPSGNLKSANLLDRWIISRCNSTVREVTDMLDRYEPTRAARAIQVFVIDELSNWYLRRSRRRFWKNEMSDDKLAAYETFYTVLRQVTILSAPFIPFLSEAVYRRLRGAKDSVHLELYPAVDESAIDADLEKRMAGVLKTVSAGHSLRNTAQVKVRTPLAELFVHSPYPVETEWLGSEEFAFLVRDELNVKKITLLDSPERQVKYKVKADFSKLGKRLGKNMKQAAGILEALDAAGVKTLLSKGEIAIELDGQKEVITKKEVQILQETAQGFIAGTDGDLTVILDTRLTSELIKEGLARELVNRIQNFRKESGLEVSDRIELSFRASEEVSVVFREFGEHICMETLAASLDEGEKDWKFTTAFKAGEYSIELWMRRL